MDIFNLLIGYIFVIFCVFCADAVISATLRSIKEVTGQTLREHCEWLLTWGILNPTWAWNVIENLFPTKGQQVKYFKF